MSLRELADLRFNSSLARRVLRCVYKEGNVYRVLMGPLRGARLVYHSSMTFHVILGASDLGIFRFLERVLVRGGFMPPESLVADVGANLGFYTLWFARHFRSVHAFEPAPRPRTFLEENMAANSIRNVTIVNAACGSTDGSADFFLSPNAYCSSFDSSWAAGGDTSTSKITVPVVTLDSHFGGPGNAWPGLIKMDIEGGGTVALPGATRCLAEKRPFLLIESHTPDEDRAISAVLTQNDFVAWRFNTRSWVMDRTDTHPNPEGVWGTMFVCPSEKRRQIAARI